MDSPDIRIVLVAPSHPGNIGAAARAMKNMALASLVLVRPREFPHPEATARASGADDVLAAAARILAAARRAPAAVVFGAKRTGLTNEELDTAHVLLRIPASEAYPSLNLAMAVQLVAYELYRARAV